MRIRNCVLASMAIAILIVVTTSPLGAEEDTPAPAIVMASLLDAIRLDSDEGTLGLKTVTTVFMPEGSKMVTVVTDDEGKMLNQYTWKGGKDDGVFRDYRLSTSSHGNPNSFKLTEEGDYVLVFAVDGEAIHTLPFSVDVGKGASLYKPATVYRMDGPWEDYGYLSFKNDDDDEALQFSLWLRTKGKTKNGTASAVAEVELKGPRGELGETEVDLKLKAAWSEFTFEFEREGETVSGEDMTDIDGDYSVEIEIDGKDYATFEFTVDDGEIAMQGRQVREGTDPTVYIEGGGSSWWALRKGARESLDDAIEIAGSVDKSEVVIDARGAAGQAGDNLKEGVNSLKKAFKGIRFKRQ